MRVSIVSILLAGGMLALGACSTSVDSRPLTLAELTEQCRNLRVGLSPTGRQTGDARQDYECNVVHAGGGPFDRRDRNVTSASASRERASAIRTGG